MGRKPKPINNLNEFISESEVQLFEWSFEKKPNIISLLIEDHIKKSACKDCNWKLMIFGYLDKEEVKNFQAKPCFYRMNFDLIFLKPNHLNEIKERFNIVEDEGFKPIPLDFNGVLIIYCE